MAMSAIKASVVMSSSRARALRSRRTYSTTPIPAEALKSAEKCEVLRPAKRASSLTLVVAARLLRRKSWTMWTRSAVAAGRRAGVRREQAEDVHRAS